ncbi:MAG: hypothetical protein ACI9LO_002296 [Planctomycetota bacterium]|jgi:hypothetical protein
MISTLKSQFSSFGFLRQGLAGLAVATMLLPVIEWGVVQLVGELGDRSILSLAAGLVAPVMAPILIVVLLLDVIMSKVRAADDPESSGDLHRRISRVQSVMIVAMLVFWIPFFMSIRS